jgi:hypothetical protein
MNDRHEHLYREVHPYMLRSDQFKHYIPGIQVFLCTLSMLSHYKLHMFTAQAPIHVLVVDEASQIGTKDYLSVLNNFQESLKRIVFIGDDKQREHCVPFLHYCPMH